MQHARPIGPTGVNAAAPFEPSMAQGCHPPEQSRFYSPVNRQGLSLSQTTHVPAVFAPAMVQGVTVPQPRYMAPQHTGWFGTTTEVLSFDVVAVGGSHPDQPRILLGPKIPLPVSQTTHDQAPFAPAMVQGSHPDTPRLPFTAKLGWSVSQTTHVQAPLSRDMFTVPAGQSGYTAPLHTGWFSQSSEVAPFALESVFGSHPDTPRLLLGVKLPQPFSPTTHTSAAFSPSMVQGVRPPEQSHYRPAKLGWSVSLLETLLTATFTGKVYLVSSHLRGFSVPGHDRLFTTTTHGRTHSVPSHDRLFSPPSRKRNV